MAKEGIIKRMTIAVTALVTCFTLTACLMKVSATTDSSMLSFTTSGGVVLNGEDSGQVDVYLTAAQAEKLYTVQGVFSTTEIDDSNQYFTVNSFGLDSAIYAYDLEHNPNTGQFYYKYSMAGNGVDFAAGDYLYKMTYDVKADTPAGTYHLPIDIIYVQQESLDDYEEDTVVNATVTVVRESQPVEKPEQVVTFRDGDDAVIGAEGITKYYDDDDFTITKEVTTGDGAIFDYHPDDDGSGAVANTIPGSDLVGVGEPGDVDICAWVAETENYAETKACYTVHVVKRPLDIVGAVVSNRTYDGTVDATVTSVSFSDRDLSNDEYTVSAQFEDANAGENKALSVEVALIGDAANRYVLNDSTFNTTAAIEAKGINNDNLIAPNSVVEGHIISEDEISINVDGKDLVRCETSEQSNCDYTIVISGNTGFLGDIVNVSVNARGNYTGVAAKDISIVAKAEQTVAFEDSEIEAVYGDSEFTNAASTNGDGVISYRSSDEAVATVDAESGAVTIVGVGEVEITATAAETDTYAEGTASYTLVVSKKTVSIESATVEAKQYDGTTDATVTSVTLSEDGLELGVDYNVSNAYYPSANAGSYVGAVVVEVTLTGSASNYYQFDSEGAASASIYADSTITSFVLDGDNTTVELSGTEFSYTGEEITPTATVTVDLDGDGTKETALTAGTDYTISYYDNTNAGTGTMLVNGSGNFASTVGGFNFTIVPATVTDVVVTAEAQTYTGETLEPVVTVTGTVNGETVAFTTDDYEVAAHGNFIMAGDYQVTINAKEGSNYAIPTTSGTFTIEKAVSDEPGIADGFRIEAGSTLADLGDMIEGFSWVDSSEVVALGDNSYGATYVRDNDTDNYLPVEMEIPVYGLKRVEVEAFFNDGGSVSGPGDSALEGEEITFNVSPDDGYELLVFVLNGVEVTDQVSSNQFKTTVPDEDVRIIALFRKVYNIINTVGTTHILGTDATAEFEIDADYELFGDLSTVYIDGEEIDAENYDSWSASTVISLKADYLNTLAAGEHLFEVEFDDIGIARAALTIVDPNAPAEESEENAPGTADTGVFTGAVGGAVATGASVMVMCALVSAVYLMKKNKKAE